MVIYDGSGARLDGYDETQGTVELRDVPVLWRWVEDTAEEGHWEVAAKYENGGEDVEWVIDEAATGHWELTDAASGGALPDCDLEPRDDWPHDVPIPDTWQYGVFTPYADEELAAQAEERAQAEQAMRASAQLPVALSLLMAPVTPTLTASQVASVSELLPEWRSGATYKRGEAFRCDGVVYRAAQDVTAVGHYRPGPGLESLYTKLDLAPDGLRVWHAPTGATDAFEDGERAHYPDADGPVYVSRRDGNTSVPGADEWWVTES